MAKATTDQEGSGHMLLRALVGPMLILITGCQSTPLLGWSERDQGTVSVMALWKTYEHCRATGNADAKQSDARDLASAARQANVIEPSPIPLPALLQRHVHETAPRYSVDPQALSASCSLEAGNAALRVGHHADAADLFQFVLATYPEAEYEYYTRQARRGLQQIETRRMVSATGEPRLLPVTSR